METAILWHLTPSAFFAAPDMDRALMLAHHRERNLRKAMLDKIQHDTAERKAQPKPSTGPDPHAAFFKGL
ncbi:MAG: hypothetical protein NTW21_23160 [Verrucomicrobia bacterium]|nr:hypothetical protein [Verrucomicrobiota bacterium]